MLTFTDNPETKLVRDLAFADYNTAHGVNNSSLSWFDEWSGGAPAKYKFYMEHPGQRPDPSAAMLDGSCYHHFVLCPDSFAQFYAVRTKEIEDNLFALAKADKKCRAESFSTRLKVYQEWETQQADEGRLVITQARADEIRWMREALFRCDEFREIFRGGGLRDCELELSAFCGYEFRRGPHIGKRLQLKARIDLVPAGDALLDLKSARTAHREEFARQCWKLSYNRQAAWYLDVYNANADGRQTRLSQVSERKMRFGFLAQDKTPPYLACVHWVNTWIAHGRQRYEVILSNLADAIARDYWPGYESGELMPPSWAESELEAA